MNILAYILIGIFAVVFLWIFISWILKRMKGSIKIIPEKYTYNTEEEIKGKVVLNLKKNVNSKKLIVGLKCVKSQRKYSRGNNTSTTENYTVFEFNEPLEMEKQYSASEYSYDFSIKIPKNASQQLEGVAGAVFRPAKILFQGNSSFKWYLYSELQCGGVDLFKEIQINVL